MKFSKEDILEKISSNYEYNFEGFKNTKSYITLICKEHGEYPIRIDKLLSGQICPGCSKIKSNNKLRKSQELYIKECELKHNFKYDYSKTIYEKCDSYIKVICPVHREFKIRADHHRRGQGCKDCYILKNKENQRKSNEFFINEAINIHGKFYDYSKLEYINNTTPVIIICPIHGDFSQRPHTHIIKKSGCPYCKQSKGEKTIKDFLTKINIKFEEQKRFKNCINKNKLPFDFYLPEYNLCIEYDGKQHYEPIDFFGGELNHKRIKENDKIKNQYCQNNNIGLFRITYKDDITEKLLFLFNNMID